MSENTQLAEIVHTNIKDSPAIRQRVLEDVDDLMDQLDAESVTRNSILSRLRNFVSLAYLKRTFTVTQSIRVIILSPGVPTHVTIDADSIIAAPMPWVCVHGLLTYFKWRSHHFFFLARILNKEPRYYCIPDVDSEDSVTAFYESTNARNAIKRAVLGAHQGGERCPLPSLKHAHPANCPEFFDYLINIDPINGMRAFREIFSRDSLRLLYKPNLTLRQQRMISLASVRCDRYVKDREIRRPNVKRIRLEIDGHLQIEEDVELTLDSQNMPLSIVFSCSKLSNESKDWKLRVKTKAT